MCINKQNINYKQKKFRVWKQIIKVDKDKVGGEKRGETKNRNYVGKENTTFFLEYQLLPDIKNKYSEKELIW